jgi:hypothetical protein
VTARDGKPNRTIALFARGYATPREETRAAIEPWSATGSGPTKTAQEKVEFTTVTGSREIADRPTGLSRFWTQRRDGFRGLGGRASWPGFR